METDQGRLDPPRREPLTLTVQTIREFFPLSPAPQIRAVGSSWAKVNSIKLHFSEFGNRLLKIFNIHLFVGYFLRRCCCPQVLKAYQQRDWPSPESFSLQGVQRENRPFAGLSPACFKIGNKPLINSRFHRLSTGFLQAPAVIQKGVDQKNDPPFCVPVYNGREN